MLFSVAAMYSQIGGSLGTMIKFGPWANRHSCDSVRGVLEMFLTQFLPMVLVLSLSLALLFLIWSEFEFEQPCSPCWMFEWPPVLLWHNLLNLATRQSKVFRCLDSLLILIKFVHSSIVSLSNLSSRVFLHVSHCKVNMVIELFINLFLSLSRALSAFLIIYFPLGVLILLLSLTLTGITSLLRHLREILLWFSSPPSYIHISPFTERFQHSPFHILILSILGCSSFCLV